MSVRLSRPKSWSDSQSFICMACNKHAIMKLEARVDVPTDHKEWGPAQTLRLCRNHTDIVYGLLFDLFTEIERIEASEEAAPVIKIQSLDY